MKEIRTKTKTPRSGHPVFVMAGVDIVAGGRILSFEGNVLKFLDEHLDGSVVESRMKVFKKYAFIDGCFYFQMKE